MGLTWDEVALQLLRELHDAVAVTSATQKRRALKLKDRNWTLGLGTGRWDLRVQRAAHMALWRRCLPLHCDQAGRRKTIDPSQLIGYLEVGTPLLLSTMLLFAADETQTN